MRVPAVYMRGGTSKALFFHEADLPSAGPLRDQFILAAFGSPDQYRTQLNGLGGATSSTSKVAVIGDGSQHGVDVTFEFGQVGIDQPFIDRKGTCGNISSAVGPFAVDEGLVTVTDPVTTVRFLNLNTSKIVHAHVATRDGTFDPTGEYEIPGVPGTGSVVQLDYLDPGGAVTGSLLPTGNVADEIDVPGVGRIVVSIVDAGNPIAFVSWEALGLSGLETHAEVDGDPGLLQRIENVRAACSVLAGIATTPERATLEIPSVPKVAFVGAPRDYVLSDGRKALAAETSIRAGAVSMGRLHKSYPLTAAIATTVAASITGSVVNRVAVPIDQEYLIGHTSGIVSMTAAVSKVNGAWNVEKVTTLRTARRLMEGAILVP